MERKTHTLWYKIPGNSQKPEPLKIVAQTEEEAELAVRPLLPDGAMIYLHEITAEGLPPPRDSRAPI